MNFGAMRQAVEKCARQFFIIEWLPEFNYF
jgi:hypothetical protein